MQVGFGYAFARQEWTDEEFGLKRFQGTGRLSLLLVNSMDGLQEMLQSPIPELFSVCTKGLHTGSVLFLFVIVWMLTCCYSVFQYLHPLKAEQYRETTRAIRKIARNCIQIRLSEIEHGEPPRNDIVGSIIEAISEFPSHQWVSKPSVRAKPGCKLYISVEKCTCTYCCIWMPSLLKFGCSFAGFRIAATLGNHGKIKKVSMETVSMETVCSFGPDINWSP